MYRPSMAWSSTSWSCGGCQQKQRARNGRLLRYVANDLEALSHVTNLFTEHGIDTAPEKLTLA